MIKNKEFIVRTLLVLAILAVLISIGLIYKNRISKKGIYRNVLNRDGYKITAVQKPAHFTSFIEPDWIPTKQDEKLKLNKEIAQIDHVKIILESVWHRGNDICFNFDAIPYITYKGGEFLYNCTFNDDGTVTSYDNFIGFHVTNKNDKNIEVGQRGFGPDSKFSFCIDKDDYDLIKDGFTFEYDSSILYEYSRFN